MIKPSIIILVDGKTNWLGKPTLIFKPFSNGLCALELLLNQIQNSGSDVVLSVKDYSFCKDLLTPVTSRFPHIKLLSTNQKNDTERLSEAIQKTDSDLIIRLSADNPISGLELLEEMKKNIHSEKDFAHTYGFPTGINIDLFHRSCVRAAIPLNSERRLRYICEFELDSINVHRITPTSPDQFQPYLRWTLGTIEDFQRLNKALQDIPYDSVNISSVIREWSRLFKNEIPNPITAHVEPTNACNLKCTMCPRPNMKRPVGFMTLEDAELIAEQCQKAGIREILLNGFGEPFLHKNFQDILNIFLRKNFHITINTNACFLTKEASLALLEHPPAILNISLDGASAETYESIRKNSDYNEVKSNILFLLENRKKGSLPKIILKLIRMKETQNEVNEFVKQWADIADEIQIPNIHNWGDEFESQGKMAFKTHRFPCQELWRTVFITFDGVSCLCCADYDKKVVLGDLKTNNLLKIWNSKEMNQLRALHLSSKWNKIPLCKNCDMWKVHG